MLGIQNAPAAARNAAAHAQLLPRPAASPRAHQLVPALQHGVGNGLAVVRLEDLHRRQPRGLQLLVQLLQEEEQQRRSNQCACWNRQLAALALAG